MSARPGPLPALVAPDSFKGTFSAREVAAAIAAGLREAGREAEELPVADGGEGTVDVLVTALGGELRSATVSDPLGRPVEASFALLPDGRTAAVEVAQASGLWRVAEHERSPRENEVDVLLAIDVPDPRPLTTRSDDRLAAYTSKRAHRRVHTTGKDLARPGHHIGGSHSSARSFRSSPA